MKIERVIIAFMVVVAVIALADYGYAAYTADKCVTPTRVLT